MDREWKVIDDTIEAILNLKRGWKSDVIHAWWKGALYLSHAQRVVFKSDCDKVAISEKGIERHYGQY